MFHESRMICADQVLHILGNRKRTSSNPSYLHGRYSYAKDPGRVHQQLNQQLIHNVRIIRCTCCRVPFTTPPIRRLNQGYPVLFFRDLTLYYQGL
jgi:hypothetical protein